MKGNIEERACDIAKYIIDNKQTVRNAAKVFNISKSTVQSEMTVSSKRTAPFLNSKSMFLPSIFTYEMFSLNFSPNDLSLRLPSITFTFMVFPLSSKSPHSSALLVHPNATHFCTGLRTNYRRKTIHRIVFLR